MAAEAAAEGMNLVSFVILLGAGVVAVPLFKRLGLGSVLGYLIAGILIGPSVLGFVGDAEDILHIAELGVVMFLFIIGLEMEPTKLWSLRKEIFGLGVLQVVACGLLLTVVGIIAGFAWPVAFVAGMGFVLTSTAIVMQILQERGEVATTGGQRIVSVLLLEDLAIVPLLALVALLAPEDSMPSGSRLFPIAVALGSVLALIGAGRYLLNPIFRVLADSKAREVMTAAALLVVLGAALLMQWGGLSMAMGAFLAGVLLSTSTFRHQLEADVEPFRGLLLGIFFLAVGMSLNLAIVAQNWVLIALLVLGYMAVKSVAIYVIARLTRSDHREALQRAILMAQGGEFAFVLFTTATSSGLLSAEMNAILTATVIVSMILTPFAVMLLPFILPKPQQSMDGVEVADGLTGNILVIGFGRFGQIVSQPLIARGYRISIIDNDTDMIRAAARFGFKIYYGDGTRLDILRAAGAASADAVLIAVDKKGSATRITELMKSEFPLVKVMSRAYDRVHALELVKAGVDYQLRELFESSLTFGNQVLIELGATPEEAAELIEGVRDRDRMRFEAQLLTSDIDAARDFLLKNAEEQAEEVGVKPSREEPVLVDDESAKAPAS
jgi:glutathione-regulated potassium-efflux system protein KefB